MKQIKALLTRNNEAAQQQSQQRDLQRDHSARTDARFVSEAQPQAEPVEEQPQQCAIDAALSLLRICPHAGPRRGVTPVRCSRSRSAGQAYWNPSVRRLTVIPMVRRSSNGSVKGQLAPSSFYCPISMELMSDPVVLATGHTYERVCIERWLQQGNRTCPVTGMRLRHLELTPNFALRVAVQAGTLLSIPRSALDYVALLVPLCRCLCIMPQALLLEVFRSVCCMRALLTSATRMCCMIDVYKCQPAVAPARCQVYKMVVMGLLQSGHLTAAMRRDKPAHAMGITLLLLQEWAAANGVPLTIKDPRANTTSYYRLEEDPSVPTNILQVSCFLLKMWRVRPPC